MVTRQILVLKFQVRALVEQQKGLKLFQTFLLCLIHSSLYPI